MKQHTRYKGVDDDIRQEHLTCKVPGGCDPSHDLCGIRRGIKYGLYPKNSLSMPKTLVDRELTNQIRSGIGNPEVPIFAGNDGMSKFADSVARYTEPWMKYERWDLV